MENIWSLYYKNLVHAFFVLLQQLANFPEGHM